MLVLIVLKLNRNDTARVTRTFKFEEKVSKANVHFEAMTIISSYFEQSTLSSGGELSICSHFRTTLNLSFSSKLLFMDSIALITSNLQVQLF